MVVCNQVGCPNGRLCTGSTGTGCSGRVISPCCLQLGDITESSGKLFSTGCVSIPNIFVVNPNFTFLVKKTLCKSLYFSASQYHLHFYCLILFHNTIVFCLFLFLNTSFYLFLLSKVWFLFVSISLPPCNGIEINVDIAALFLILTLFFKCRLQWWHAVQVL